MLKHVYVCIKQKLFAFENNLLSFLNLEFQYLYS